MYTLDAGPSLAPRLRAKTGNRFLKRTAATPWASGRRKIKFQPSNRYGSSRLFASLRPSYQTSVAAVLGGWDDENLGKFKLKKAFKKVVKTVGKIAAAPAAASLQAVGLKKISGKVGKAVGYTKGEMNAIKSAGKGLQAAAVAAGAVYAAPYALTAGKVVAGKVIGGGKILGGLLKPLGKIAKPLAGLIKKGGKSSGDLIQDVDAPGSTDQQVSPGAEPQTEVFSTPSGNDGAASSFFPGGSSGASSDSGGGQDSTAPQATEAGMIPGIPGLAGSAKWLIPGAAIAIYVLTGKKKR